MLRRLVLLGVCLPLAAYANETPSETWLVKTDMWGNTAYQTLLLSQKGNTLSGTFDGDRLVGSRHGASLDVTVTDADKATYHLKATIDGEAMVGIADDPDTNHPGRRVSHAFTGRRLPERSHTSPQVYVHAQRLCQRVLRESCAGAHALAGRWYPYTHHRFRWRG